MVVIVIQETPTFTGYVTNAIVNITEFSFEIPAVVLIQKLLTIIHMLLKTMGHVFQLLKGVRMQQCIIMIR